jgi:hypothetical protein
MGRDIERTTYDLYCPRICVAELKKSRNKLRISRVKTAGTGSLSAKHSIVMEEHLHHCTERAATKCSAAANNIRECAFSAKN